MGLIAVFPGKSAPPRETIINLEFYGVYLGSDREIRALMRVNNKVITSCTDDQIERLIQPNLVNFSQNFMLHKYLHNACISARAECVIARMMADSLDTNVLYKGELNHTSMAYGYTPQPWPLGFDPYAPALTLG